MTDPNPVTVCAGREYRLLQGIINSYSKGDGGT